MPTLDAMLFTKYAFDSPDKAYQLFSLLNRAGSPFVPNKFDIKEPIRRPYNPNDVSKPVAMLSGTPEDQSGGLLLKGPTYKFQALFNWSANEISRWSIWIARQFFARPERVEAYISFLTQICEAFPLLYGGAAPDEDCHAKHWVVTALPGGGVTEQRVGPSLEHCLPGIYWLTIFGSPLVEHFGRATLKNLPVHHVIDLGQSGVVVILREKPFSPDHAERLRHDTEIMHILGSQYFLDPSAPDRICASIPGLR